MHVGDKIKGAIEIVHGAGDNLRGSALGAIDQMGRGGVTKNEEISRKGREEFERGMGRWKGHQTGAGVYGQAATQDTAVPYGAQGAPSPYGPQGAASQYGPQGATSPYGPQDAASQYGHQGATPPYGPQGAPAPSYGGQGTAYGYGQGRAGDVKAGGQQDTSYPPNRLNDTSYTGGQRYDAPTGLGSQPQEAGVGSNYPATPGKSGSGAQDV